MMQLQKTFSTAADVRLVSITVDPEHDTPTVLAAYAARLQAHPERWLFLTGDKKHIYWLAQQGFHLGVYDIRDTHETSKGQPVTPRAWVTAGLWRVFAPAVALAHHPQTPQGDAAEAIQHSDRFVLVDRQGHIRQYYSSQDKDVLQRLERDVTRLRAES
jgi:protein SCO1/2